jgi:beta-lysine N6-acetyltransferase
MTRQTDIIEKIGGSIIQHGSFNRRIYLMKLDPSDLPEIVETLLRMARDKGYSKIFAKIPADAAGAFRERGFVEEAAIPGFFNGQGEAVFLSHFLTEERMTPLQLERIEEIIALAKEKFLPAEAGSYATKSAALDSRFVLRQAGPEDVEAMAAVYQRVFPTYPFPIHEPDYLLETMRGHIEYFGVETDGRLIALSSAEKDATAQNVEMTDFATLPECRGHGLAYHLLAAMETAVMQRGFKTAYTIARALSPGMNITFAKLGYTFGGTLVNNTNISGSIETMNVWFRLLENT